LDSSKKANQKYLEISEKWCWRRKEKIIWTNSVINDGVLRGVKEARKILHTIKEGRLIELVTPCAGTVF
jgi:hypothetical protein